MSTMHEELRAEDLVEGEGLAGGEGHKRVMCLAQAVVPSLPRESSESGPGRRTGSTKPTTGAPRPGCGIFAAWKELRHR